MKLEFFWDVVSPYSYLASTQLEALARKTGVELVYRPFLLGGVFKAAGNTAPAAVPAKAVYLLADLDAWRTYYGVPMKVPPELPFPINSLQAMRAAVAADRAGHGRAYCDAVFGAYWGQGRDISQPEVLRRALDGAGLDGAQLLAEADGDAVKLALRANTDEAVQRGAFGAPTFFLGPRMFWGNDRLDLIAAALANQGRR